MNSKQPLRLLVLSLCLAAGSQTMAQTGTQPAGSAQPTSAAHAGAVVEPAWKTVKRLVHDDNASDKDSLRALLPTLAASSDETDMSWAARGYYVIGEKKLSDSLLAVIPTKFPEGMAARDHAESEIYKEKDVAKKVELYNAWVRQFPESKFPNEDHDHIVYDYARNDIANTYAKQKNVAKAEFWVNQVEEDFYKGNSYGGVAQTFQNNDNIPMAEKYYKKAMLSAQKYYNDSLSTDNAVRFAASGYPGLMNEYTQMLVKQKKFAEALPWAKRAMALSKEPNRGAAFNYAILLKHLHRYSEAFHTLEPVIKGGEAAPEMVDTFKVLYVKVKGSDEGYAAYADAIHKAYIKNLKQRLVKDEMKQPAVEFTLTDVNGKQVSLADYRGKVVVLDFWATWCGPCKASFPAMKMAQEKYKGGDSVQFLFIHTWERDTSAALATANAKAYVDDNHYPFEVLMDLKDRDSATNLVAERYKLTGIPAKFVIDRTGNIRFKLTGFSGSPEAAVEELSMMIDMARK